MDFSYKTSTCSNIAIITYFNLSTNIGPGENAAILSNFCSFCNERPIYHFKIFNRRIIGNVVISVETTIPFSRVIDHTHRMKLHNIFWNFFACRPEDKA